MKAPVYFSNTHKTEHGNTVIVDTPKISAYIHACYLQGLGVCYDIKYNADGTYTVTGDDLETVTFEAEGEL